MNQINPKSKLNTDINNEKDRSQKVKLYATSFITNLIYSFIAELIAKEASMKTMML